VLQVEAFCEVGGALADLWVAWSYASGNRGLTVDQAAALVVVAVVSGRVLIQAARRCWQHHHRMRPNKEFPPDRLVIFLCTIISDHPTLPYLCL